jgi:hypothetical protein
MHIEFYKVERNAHDPPPQQTWLSICTGLLNRWLNELLRHARFTGLV